MWMRVEGGGGAVSVSPHLLLRISRPNTGGAGRSSVNLLYGHVPLWVVCRVLGGVGTWTPLTLSELVLVVWSLTVTPLMVMLLV
mmetsp:Transcript_17395/g.35341  ORF Transcript_17395/g.35341 Transcript_17395/m.35341 type:complete len:84 (-) Transcript_17395:154-405(-)